MNDDRCALLVFAKEPVAGDVKTRLQTTLTREEAAEVYRAFLDDAAAQYSSLSCDLRYYLAPRRSTSDDSSSDHPTTDKSTVGNPGSGKSIVHDPKTGYQASVAAVEGFGLIPTGATILAQTGTGLGERMLNAFVDAFKAGYNRLVVIGTDHPTLPTAYIEQAFIELRTRRTVVVGPTTDGGYYLLGMNELFPALFREMSYSHPDVFRDTMHRIGATDANVAVLPVWSDVDTPAALISLWHEIRNTESAPPATKRVAARLARKYGWT